MPTDTRPILYVEDSEQDFLSMTVAFRTIGLANPLIRCTDGLQAQGSLLSAQGCAAIGRAALVLLDLNLPGLHGAELITDVRRLGYLIPIVIFSTSAHPDDIERCYRAGANAFLKKPLEFDGWEKKIAALADFWLRTAELPAAAARVRP